MSEVEMLLLKNELIEKFNLGSPFSHRLAERLEENYKEFTRTIADVRDALDYDIKGLKQVDETLIGIVKDNDKKISLAVKNSRESSEHTSKASKIAECLEKDFGDHLEKTENKINEIKKNFDAKLWAVMIILFSAVVGQLFVGLQASRDNVKTQQEIKNETLEMFKPLADNLNLIADEIKKQKGVKK